jgi:hypothetical protein
MGLKNQSSRRRGRPTMLATMMMVMMILQEPLPRGQAVAAACRRSGAGQAEDKRMNEMKMKWMRIASMTRTQQRLVQQPMRGGGWLKW